MVSPAILHWLVVGFVVIDGLLVVLRRVVALFFLVLILGAIVLLKGSASLSLFILAIILYVVLHALRSALLALILITSGRHLVCLLFFAILGIFCFRLIVHLLVFFTIRLAIQFFDRHDGLFGLLDVHGSVLLTIIDMIFLIGLAFLICRLILLVLLSFMLLGLAFLLSIAIALLSFRLCIIHRSHLILFILVLILVVFNNVDRSLLATVISVIGVLLWVLRGSLTSFFLLFFFIVGWLACLVLFSLFSLKGGLLHR